MSTIIDCTCGKKLSVKPELGGKTVKCPGCGKMMTVPGVKPNKADTIQIRCQCSKTLSVKSAMAGKKGKCPTCGSIFDIPADSNSHGGQDPFGIPFADAATLPTNNAFWVELQKSAASTSSKSPLKASVGNAHGALSTNSFIQNERTTSDGRKSRTPIRSIFALFGFCVSLLYVFIGIFGILDNTGAFDSSELRDARAKSIAATEKYESEYMSNRRLERRSLQEVNGKPGGLIGAIKDFNDTVSDESTRYEIQENRQRRESQDSNSDESKTRQLMGCIVIFIVSLAICGFCFQYRFIRPLAS